MEYKFTEDQLSIRETLREFTKKEVVTLDSEMDKTGFNTDLYKKMQEIGLLGIHYPEEYGGAGLDPVTGAMVIHEIAKGSASMALFLDAHWLAADAVLHYGNEQQKKKYLPIAANEGIFAFGLTEPDAGSDAAGIKTTAKRDGNCYVLNGRKAWITNACTADVFVVMAKTSPELGAKGITAFIVEKDTPGLTVCSEEVKMGMRGSNTAGLIFEDMRVPEENILGQVNGGFKIAMTALDCARISIGAISCGLSEHALEIAKNYALERVAFGEPIANFQAIQFKIADMVIGIENMKLITYNVAEKYARGERFTLEAACCKVYTAETCVRICDQAIQILGGNGYSKEYPAEQLYRDAKLLEIGEGTSEILRMLIGRMALSR